MEQNKSGMAYENMAPGKTQVHKALAKVFLCFTRLEMAWDSPSNSATEERKSFLFFIPFV